MSGKKMVRYTEEQVIDLIIKDTRDGAFICWLPWCVTVRDITKNCSRRYGRKGYLYVCVDGEIREIAMDET